MNTLFRFRNLKSLVLLALLSLLVPLGLYAPPIQAANLVLNPGFETGALSPWTSFGAVVVVNTDAHTGTFAAKITGRGAPEQVVSGLSQNTAYTVSGWAKVGTAGDSICIGAKEYDGTSNQVSQCVTLTSYLQVAAAFTTGAANTSAKVFCYHSAGGNKVAYCDDFTLTATSQIPTATPTPNGPTPTPTATSASGPQPIGIPGSWTLKFADEFNGASLNTADWWPNWVNATSPTQITEPVNTTEDAAYDPAQVTLSGGNLNLALIASPVTIGSKTYPYRSGMIQTEGNHSCNCPMHQFTFGAFEARINLPASGTAIANWPAWWTDGQNWPADGEMDIMEGLSGAACYNFHSRHSPPGGCPAGNFTGWHTYASNWQSGVVNYYYDGALVGTQNSGITSSPMYLILNYATGGCCAGPIVAPATMQVDYVRVWQ
jgi:beta-glucanase (GH16 family)